MSGECEKCDEHCLECTCETLCRCRQNVLHRCYEHLNPAIIPLDDGTDLPRERLPEPKWINVRGREEHESIIRDSKKCEELGLDQYYEIMTYLLRWGNWLSTKQ